ncbi:unnamed protein product [Rhizoctonia solani]|uniref:Uncharacterized protein n=1 Tax=Rhizoctonia solani TaxID=456999 RepID=A0A8H3HCH0_9AGAM|nr:unnamed protein product [Rhizoctonia solani]
MSAPATTTRASTAVAPTVPAASTALATTRVASSAAATSIVATPALSASTFQTSARTRTGTRRHTTTITSASSAIPTVVPFSPEEERQADSRQTNKILIGIFTSLGVIFLGVIAFQLFRCYKRRYRKKGTPLPPPREGQIGFSSRAVSMYKDSRPASVMMHHGSGSGLVASSVRSNAPSMEIRVDETGRRNDPSRDPGHISRDDSPDNSLTGPALAPNDEELGLRRSPLGSRSHSPANLSSSRPPSQGQGSSRPEAHTRTARSNSASANQRHSHYGSHGSNRNSTYDASRRSSFYAAGNRGAPHSPHARERVGLMMPQPLAPEAFSYALNGRQDAESRGNLPAGSEQDLNQPLAPPRFPRPDSWVVSSHSSLSNLNDSPITSDAPSPPQKDGTLPRGRDRTSRAETSQS